MTGQGFELPPMPGGEFLPDEIATAVDPRDRSFENGDNRPRHHDADKHPQWTALDAAEQLRRRGDVDFRKIANAAARKRCEAGELEPSRARAWVHRHVRIFTATRDAEDRHGWLGWRTLQQCATYWVDRCSEGLSLDDVVEAYKRKHGRPFPADSAEALELVGQVGRRIPGVEGRTP